MSDANKIAKSGHGKLCLLCFFLAIDVALNSTLDYDKLNNQSRTLILGLFGLQIIDQLAVFLILFLTLADTFLFRVGLLNILIRKTRVIIVIQSIYFLLSILTGSYRLNYFDTDQTAYYLATNDGFVSLSMIQKIAAVVYYVANVYYTIKLEDPIYYNKDAWIALIRQVRCLFFIQFLRFILTFSFSLATKESAITSSSANTLY